MLANSRIDRITALTKRQYFDITNNGNNQIGMFEGKIYREFEFQFKTPIIIQQENSLSLRT